MPPEERIFQDSALAAIPKSQVETTTADFGAWPAIAFCTLRVSGSVSPAAFRKFLLFIGV